MSEKLTYWISVTVKIFQYRTSDDQLGEVEPIYRISAEAGISDVG